MIDASDSSFRFARFGMGAGRSTVSFSLADWDWDSETETEQDEEIAAAEFMVLEEMTEARKAGL